MRGRNRGTSEEENGVVDVGSKNGRERCINERGDKGFLFTRYRSISVF